MSGGGLGGNGNTMGALQNYPLVPNSDGGAQASPAGAAPQAQSLSQLQTFLQSMGQGGQKSPAMQVGGLGQQLMRAGQQPMPQMSPQMHAIGAAAPMQAPAIPQMGMQSQLTPSMMNLLLARQNGLIG